MDELAVDISAEQELRTLTQIRKQIHSTAKRDRRAQQQQGTQHRKAGYKSTIARGNKQAQKTQVKYSS